MRQHPRALAIAITLLPLFGAFAVGCDDGELAPSPVTGPIAVESFIGTVAVGSSSFYSFTQPREGAVVLTLVQLTENGQPTAATVGLGIGTPLGVGCTAGISAAASPSGTPHLRQVMPPGVYCVKVSDTGQLTATASFALNIQHPR